MKPSFKLDAHPRRPRPLLSSPPAGYFDQLPMRVMARLPQAEARETAFGWRWLALLSPAFRTGLASLVMLSGFAASFFLSSPMQPGKGVAANTSLDAVPRTELVGYLLTSEARVETFDLAILTAADPSIIKSFLHASDEELNDVLDTQPSDDLTHL